MVSKISSSEMIIENELMMKKERSNSHPRRRSVLFLFAVLLHVDPLDGAAGGAHLRVAAARVRI